MIWVKVTCAATGWGPYPASRPNRSTSVPRDRLPILRRIMTPPLPIAVCLLSAGVRPLCQPLSIPVQDPPLSATQLLASFMVNFSAHGRPVELQQEVFRSGPYECQAKGGQSAEWRTLIFQIPRLPAIARRLLSLSVKQKMSHTATSGVGLLSIRQFYLTRPHTHANASFDVGESRRVLWIPAPGLRRAGTGSADMTD